MRTCAATLILLLALSAAASASEPLRVVATTTIVGDIVRAVAGDRAEVAVLLPADADPHAFDPSPRDAARLADADLVFVNGLGLETFLPPLLRSAGGDGRAVVSLSDGIAAREGEHDHAECDDAHHDHGALDPHVWLDPRLVMTWVDNAERALAARSPADAAAFAGRAAATRRMLEDLDAWIRDEVAAIPPERRLFATDHDEFGYFAERYGFRIVGCIVPSLTTLAEPSARGLADLQRALEDSGARVIVMGRSGNPALAERLAHDTGARVVRLYTGSLGTAGGPAGTYRDYMRYNVGELVRALRGAAP